MTKPQEPGKGREVAKPNREALAATAGRIGEIVQAHETGYRAAANDLERSLVLSCSMIDLRAAVREFLPVLKQLQGSRLGFLTDRDPGKSDKPAYPDQVIVDCAVEALVRGARWVGNEFNVISGGCYLTKEHWARRVREVPGLTDLEVTPGVPELVGPKCVVEFEATWNLDGKPYHLARRFSVILRNYQTDDATIGKAEGKMLRAIYKRLTGAELSAAGDDEAVGAVEDAPPAAAADPPAADPPAEDRKATEEEMRDWDKDNDARESMQ
jgi:hypothetical protein